MGKQIPGFASLSGAGDHQPERLMMLGILDGDREDLEHAITAPPRIPYQTMFPGAFAARELPGRAFLPFCIG